MSGKPIITSLLDTDLYKFTMGAFIYKYYPEENVCFELNNRTIGSHLPEEIDEGELQEQLDHARSLSFSSLERQYLSKVIGLPEEYVDELADFKLPEILVSAHRNQFQISTQGPWYQVSLWETFILSILNELRTEKHRALTGSNGQFRLDRKIHVLKALPEINIVEFGTRRRFSKFWQRQVLRSLLEETQNIRGTSNVALAREFNIPAIGTMAHELFMVVAALYDHSPASLRGSQQVVLKQWNDLFRNRLIALTDTFGKYSFFEDFTTEQARTWAGLRQDSGDPFEFATMAEQVYRAKQIDPRSKQLVFSDGLTLEKIVNLYFAFKDTFNCSFGWGTHLTNDVGLKPLSLVVKAVSVNENETVKLSDNLAKAMGPSKKVAMYRSVFNAPKSDWEECVV